MPFLLFLLMAARRVVFFPLPKGVCLCSYYGGGLRTLFWSLVLSVCFARVFPYSPTVRASVAGVPDFAVVRNSFGGLVDRFFLVCFPFPSVVGLGWFRFGRLVPYG